jgi:hypothetical protein
MDRHRFDKDQSGSTVKSGHGPLQTLTDGFMRRD